MRIATSMTFNNGLAAMLAKQAQINRSQMQMSSGERILAPEDDPAGSAHLLDLNRDISTVTQFRTNSQRAQGRLELEDTTLDSANTMLQRIRELTVQAGNDTLNADDRQSIDYEVTQLRDSLLQLSNTSDDNGEYIFSGLKGNTPAYLDAGNGVYRYQGDLGQRSLQISYDHKIADSDHGQAVFGQIATQLDANGDGIGDEYRNVFETLDLLHRALQGTAPSPGALSQTYQPTANPLNAATTDYQFKITATDPAKLTAGDYTLTYNGPGPGNDFSNYTLTRVSDGKILTPSVPLTPGFPIDLGADFGLSIDLPSGTQITAGDRFSFTLNGAATPETDARLFTNYLRELDAAINNISDVRSRVGARLNTIDQQDSANQDFLLSMEGSRSDVRDLDYTKAVISFQEQLNALQTAQQSFTKVQQLSLFNYL